MIVVFDLDYTLLDTKKFKEGLIEVLEISPEIFAETYKIFRNDSETVYNFEKHIDYLVEQGELPIKRKDIVKNNVEKFLEKIDEYLFPESVEVLKGLKKKNAELVLLTFGNKEWQQKKVDRLKIKKYFDEIILTDTDKEKSLDFLKSKREKKYIINDNAKECDLIKKVIPQSEIILVNGPYSDNIEHDFEIYKLKDCLYKCKQ